MMVHISVSVKAPRHEVPEPIDFHQPTFARLFPAYDRRHLSFAQNEDDALLHRKLEFQAVRQV